MSPVCVCMCACVCVCVCVCVGAVGVGGGERRGRKSRCVGGVKVRVRNVSGCKE